MAGGEEGKDASFTPTQGQYLAFICYYVKLNGVAPAETDFARYFRATPPSVHQMILKLEAGGWISRTPGQRRSVKLRVGRERLPDLE